MSRCFLLGTTTEFEQRCSGGKVSAPMHVASFAEPARDRILLAVDRPADEWYGLLTHEVAHVFGFDILPGTSTPRWITEGLAEYERGAWEPSDLAALRGAVRANAIPALSSLHANESGKDPRLVYGLGHAAFEFIDSRWGKPGVRHCLFGLRQTALVLEATRSRAPFRSHATNSIRRSNAICRGGLPVADPFVADTDSTMRRPSVSRETSRRRPTVAAGLACIELGAPVEGGTRQRWGISAAMEPAVDVVRGFETRRSRHRHRRARAGNPRLRELSCDVWSGHPTDLPGPPSPGSRGGLLAPVRRSRVIAHQDDGAVPGFGYSAWFSC